MKKEYRICKRVYIDEYGEENLRYYFVQYKKLYFFKLFPKWKTVKYKIYEYTDSVYFPLEFDTFSDAEEFIKTKLITGVKRQTTKDSEVGPIKL